LFPTSLPQPAIKALKSLHFISQMPGFAKGFSSLQIAASKIQEGTFIR